MDWEDGRSAVRVKSRLYSDLLKPKPHDKKSRIFCNKLSIGRNEKLTNRRYGRCIKSRLGLKANNKFKAFFGFDDDVNVLDWNTKMKKPRFQMVADLEEGIINPSNISFKKLYPKGTTVNSSVKNGMYRRSKLTNADLMEKPLMEVSVKATPLSVEPQKLKSGMKFSVTDDSLEHDNGSDLDDDDANIVIELVCSEGEKESEQHIENEVYRGCQENDHSSRISVTNREENIKPLEYVASEHEEVSSAYLVGSKSERRNGNEIINRKKRSRNSVKNKPSSKKNQKRKQIKRSKKIDKRLSSSSSSSSTSSSSESASDSSTSESSTDSSDISEEEQLVKSRRRNKLTKSKCGRGSKIRRKPLRRRSCSREEDNLKNNYKNSQDSKSDLNRRLKEYLSKTKRK